MFEYTYSHAEHICKQLPKLNGISEESTARSYIGIVVGDVINGFGNQNPIRDELDRIVQYVYNRIMFDRFGDLSGEF